MPRHDAFNTHFDRALHYGFEIVLPRTTNMAEVNMSSWSLMVSLFFSCTASKRSTVTG